MTCGLRALNLFEDVVGRGGPNEGLGFAVVVFDVGVDGPLQCFHASEGATPELVFG